MLGVVDFAAEQNRMRTIFFCFPEHLKCIKCRPGRSAKNADHDRRIIADKLLQGRRTEIRNLEENWPRVHSRPGQQPDDTVIDESRHIRDRYYGRVRNKDFQEMSKVFLPSLL